MGADDGQGPDGAKVEKRAGGQNDLQPRPQRGADRPVTGFPEPQDLQALLARIGEDLDLAAVLREVVACACALGGADRGFIATVDAAGRAADTASSGLDEAAERRIAEWPDGPRLHTYLRDRRGVLRAPEPAAALGALGIAADALPAEPCSRWRCAIAAPTLPPSASSLARCGRPLPRRRRSASRPSPRPRPARSPTPASTATSSGRARTSRR